MSDCHICGRMIVPPDQSVRFPSCECHIDLVSMEHALRKCLGVLAGLDLNKSALVDALEAGRNALKESK